MGLEEVQQAADMVKEVADPDALFMMGTAFDDTLEDELRVTVIATGFGTVDNPVPQKEGEQPVQAQAQAQGRPNPQAAAEDKPKFVPAGVGPITPPKPLSESAAEQVEDDPFDDIFKIFNKR